MKDLTTTMQESDFIGDPKDSFDCQGARAFKRALEQLPEDLRKTVRPTWISSTSGFFTDYEWGSFTPEGRSIDLMYNAKVGDTIIFKHQK